MRLGSRHVFRNKDVPQMCRNVVGSLLSISHGDLGICQFALLGSRPVPWHASLVPLPGCKKLLKEGETGTKIAWVFD